MSILLNWLKSAGDKKENIFKYLIDKFFLKEYNKIIERQ